MFENRWCRRLAGILRIPRDLADSLPDRLDHQTMIDESKRCTARSKQSGERCRRPVTPGKQVCYYHGGNVLLHASVILSWGPLVAHR